MAEIKLVAEPVRQVGSRPTRRLRHSGRIPAVVYGHGIDPISVSLDAREVRVALNGEAGSRALLDLHVGDDRHLAVARQLQRHPVRRTVMHIDFQVVSRDEVIVSDVPVVLVGDAEAVHRGDGTVAQELTSLSVKARPADLPPHIDVDISGLEIGQTIRVSDLGLPSGVSTEVDPEATVVTGQPPQVAAVSGEEAGATTGEGAGEASATGESGGDRAGES